MDGVGLKGYYVDPEQWHEKAQMICDDFFEFITEEVNTCHGHFAKHYVLMEGAQRLQINTKTSIMIRPHVFSQKYYIDGVDQKIQELVDWKQVAYKYILHRYIEILLANPKKLTFIAIAVKILELNLPFQISQDEKNQTIVTKEMLKSLKTSKVIKAQVYQVCLNKLNEPSQGQISPKFESEVIGKTAIALGILMSHVSSELTFMAKRRAAQEQDHLEEEVCTFNLYNDKEKFQSVRAKVLRDKYIKRDLYEQLDALNPHDKLLYTYGIEKTSLFLLQEQEVRILPRVLQCCENSMKELQDSQILKSTLLHSVILGFVCKTETYTLQTIPKIEKTEELRIQCEGIYRVNPTPYVFGEDNICKGPKSVILHDFDKVIASLNARYLEGGADLAKWKFELYQDDDWRIIQLTCYWADQLENFQFDPSKRLTEMTFDELKRTPPQDTSKPSKIKTSAGLSNSKKEKEKCIIS